MKLPVEITFRNMRASKALETNVRDKVEKLEQFCDRIMSCRVVVEANHRHQHKGNLYHVRIDMTLPNVELVVSRDPDFTAAGAEVVDGIDSALDLCAEADEIMLIGGASLYQQTLARANRLYLTQIHHAFEGDTWFPELEPNQWREEKRQNFDADENNPHAYSLINFVREI